MSVDDDKISSLDEIGEGKKIAELAQLSRVEYEKRRETEAKAIGFRVSVLDELVIEARPIEPKNVTSGHFENVEPWPDNVDGATLLSEIHGEILRFCILPKHSAEIIAAWVLHAWTHDAADISPILALTSPEKRCGKTTTLSVLSMLVPKVMHTVNMTPSALFRVIDMHHPTVLIDEGDTFLRDNDDLRGILNGGHDRHSAFVWRSVGDNHEPKPFNVWAPKCIAMIGKLPDTLEDRALVVPLKRKRRKDTVERFRAGKKADFLPLRQRAQRWANDNIKHLQEADPDVPDSLNDRQQDNARAICAIADIAGANWPETIRFSLVELAAQSDDDPQSAGAMLLRDIGEILETRKGDKIGSTDLCETLCSLEESPWGEWRRGLPITTRGIAKLLKPFGIGPTRDRSGRFYSLGDFQDTLARYVTDTPEKSDTSDTSDTIDASDTKNLNNNNAVTHDDACATYTERDDEQVAQIAFKGEF